MNADKVRRLAAAYWYVSRAQIDVEELPGAIAVWIRHPVGDSRMLLGVGLSLASAAIDACKAHGPLLYQLGYLGADEQRRRESVATACGPVPGMDLELVIRAMNGE